MSLRWLDCLAPVGPRISSGSQSADRPGSAGIAELAIFHPVRSALAGPNPPYLHHTG